MSAPASVWPPPELAEEIAESMEDDLPTEERTRQWHLLAELLNDPLLMAPLIAVAPPIAYAGRLTLLAGREKTGGKSTTACAAIANASRNGVRSLYLTLDEPTSDTVQRLDRFGADANMVAIARVRPEKIGNVVVETEAEAVVIDSLEKWVEGRVLESGNSFQWNAALAPLQRLARFRNLAAVLIHHANKSSGTYRDSTAIGAAVDLIITLTSRADGSRRSKSEGRFPVSEFTARLNQETGLITFEEDSVEGIAADRGPAPLELQYRVLRLLQSAEPEGLRSSAWQSLAKEAGISRPSYYRARKSLYEAGHASYASSIYRVSEHGARWIARGPST